MRYIIFRTVFPYKNVPVSKSGTYFTVKAKANKNWVLPLTPEKKTLTRERHNESLGKCKGLS